MPLRAAVAPAPGSSDVVEVVENVASPGPRNSRHQRAASKIVRKSPLVTDVLEIGQIAGGDQISCFSHISIVGERLALTVVEYGNIRLGLAGEVASVVRPLEPLDRVPVAAGTALGEDRRQGIGRKTGRGSGGRRPLDARESSCRTGEHRGAGDEFAQTRDDGTTTQQD